MKKWIAVAICIVITIAVSAMGVMGSKPGQPVTVQYDSFGPHTMPALKTGDVHFFAYHNGTLITEWQDGSTALWDVNAAKLIHRMNAPNGAQLGALIACPRDPTLFCELQSKPGALALAFLHSRNGEEIARYAPDKLELRAVIGSTADGTRLFCATARRKLIAIDPSTGTLMSTFDLTTAPSMNKPSWWWEATKVSPDGKICALCMGDKIIAIDQSGTELWHLVPENSEQYFYPHQPLISNSIALFNVKSRMLMTISMADGKSGEGLAMSAIHDVLNVSQDGKKLAVKMNNTTVIRSSDPNDTALVHLPDDVGIMQCTFSPDGKQLWGMPGLLVKSGDEATNTVVLARSSSTFYVFDALTGKMEKELAVTR